MSKQMPKRVYKQRKSIFRKQQPAHPLTRILLGLVLISGLTASTILVLQRFKVIPVWAGIPSLPILSNKQPTVEAQSLVWGLVNLPREERMRSLEKLAQGEKNADTFRARYLLAKDYISLKQGEPALTLLTGLENDYNLLAPQILSQRARAYSLQGDQAKSKQAWLDLVNNYSNHPLAPEGLFELGKQEAKYADLAIAKFPAHPLTREIIQARLQQEPKQPKLLKLLAIYHPDIKGANLIRNQLVKDYQDQLKPEEWEAIASGYWEAAEYGKAADAYTKVPRTALSAYRYARGKHLASRPPEAKSGYLQLIADFPEAKEIGLGLRHLASLTPAQSALGYLDQVIAKFPEEAPQALREKAKILERQEDSAGATQARQLLFSQYGNSEIAAELRWQTASKLAEKGDLAGAWQNAQPITVNNPDSEYASEASFWIGKWAKQLGKDQDAIAAWQHTLARYPESYYAWRSAALLGWDVGDFSTIRQKNPSISRNPENLILPAGSELVRELYRLGEYQSAWAVWRMELKDQSKMTVEEQFTDGVLRQGIGDNLAGINQIWSLSRRRGEERVQWLKLREQKIYWEALFSFPFQTEISKWSQQHQVNPLLVTSLIRQESRFETDITSSAGALGLMQVMPDTAAWIATTANFGKYDLKNYQDNIKLGTWYLAHNHREYENSSLLAIASYNAGAGNVADWVQRFGVNDPDAFVETIPFPETYDYVKSVLGNYWNYLRLYNPEIGQKIATQQPTK